MPVIRQDALPFSVIARELVGTEYDVGVCLIFVDAPPGGGPRLHRHPYEEIFIVQEGSGLFTLGDDRLEAGPGDIVIVPATVPHTFRNTGDGPLRQLDIHVSPHFDTEWLA